MRATRPLDQIPKVVRSNSLKICKQMPAMGSIPISPNPAMKQGLQTGPTQQWISIEHSDASIRTHDLPTQTQLLVRMIISVPTRVTKIVRIAPKIFILRGNKCN